jgi:imidazolonepropionase-like amidohydrolase
MGRSWPRLLVHRHDDSVAATARAAPLVISGVNIFDPVAGAMLPERTVVIKDSRIQSIGTRDRPAATPPGARTIDAKGKFLLPGLIDAHVHVVHVLDYAHVTTAMRFCRFSWPQV